MSEATKLFIGNLPWSIGNDELRRSFEQFGKIEEAFVVTDRSSGRSRGFGFVIFESEQDAENAIKEMHDSELEGRFIKVDKASQSTDRQNNSNFRRHNNSESNGGYSRSRNDQYKRDYNNNNSGRRDRMSRGGERKYDNSGSRDRNEYFFLK